MIKLDRVVKRYENGQLAVDELTLDIAEGELCVLVGPSGCGKTTTMKMINRLIEPTSGRIFLDGDDVTHVDPVQLRRRIGYVIQQIGLFPHLTVADNVGTVPKLLGWDKARTRARVDELLDLVGLPPGQYRNRFPDQLSGGQRQRVGVARALGADPPVLLMDEPFGAIDPITRERLQNEFLRLQSEVHKTIVFVTHDIEEAVKLGDRIAVFREGGVLEQFATPSVLLAEPSSPFVEDFVGTDRALKRLSVTAIDAAELDHPPVVMLEGSLAEARQKMDAEDIDFAIVLDAEGGLHGYLGRQRAEGEGRVAERARRMDAWVRSDASLKSAFSEMLLHDAGWVAVLDADDQHYLGVLIPDSLHLAMRRSMDHQPVERRDGALDPGTFDSPGTIDSTVPGGA